MSEAWGELAALLGPKGDALARQLVDRIRSHARHPNWDCSLHIHGSRDRCVMGKVEPAQGIALTGEGQKAQNHSDVA